VGAWTVFGAAFLAVTWALGHPDAASLARLALRRRRA